LTRYNGMLLSYFQFSLWDSWNMLHTQSPRWRGLSILFMRFTVKLQSSVHQRNSFNSLYEIRVMVWWWYGICLRSFNSLYEIHVIVVYSTAYNIIFFQFSLWDSSKPLQEAFQL